MAEAIVIPIIGKDQASAALKAVRGQVVGLGDDAKKSDGLLSKLGGALADLGSMALKVGLAAATTVVIGFGAALASGVQDARAHALVMAQTQQTIESMGNAAGVSAEHVESFAASLSAASGKSLFGDDQIQAATNMLLTFGNIKGATLDLATTLTVDMAQALKKTPEDMSIMVGKLLNSADAMSAAQRMGVSFSDEQLKLGKRLFETGRIAEYQKLVLNELNKEFGGQAEAAAKADGGWAQLNDRWGEAKETMGAAVLPLLDTLVGTLNDSVMPVVETAAARFGDLVAAFQTGAEGGDFLGGIINALYSLDDVSPVFTTIGDGLVVLGGLLDDAFGEGGGLGMLLDDLREMTGIDLSPLFATFTDAATPIQGLLNVLSEVSPAFALLRGVAEEILPQLQALVMEVFGDVAAYLSENGATMLSQAQATWQSIHDTVLSLISPLAEVISAVLTQIALFWQAHDDEILAFVGTTWAQINGIIQVAMQLIQATIVPLLQGIAQFISDHGAAIQAIFGSVWNAIAAIIDGALTLIKGILTAALQIIQGDFTGAWKTIQDTQTRVGQDLVRIVQSFLEIIETIFAEAWAKVVTDVTTTWDLLKGAVDTGVSTVVGIVKALPGQLAGVGEAAVTMVWDGLKAKWGELEAWFTDQLQGLRDQLPFSEPKDASSPLYGLSKSGAAIVEMLATGLGRAGDVLPTAMADISLRTREQTQYMIDDMAAQFGRSDLPDETENFGQYIMEGLIDGMEGMVGDALDVIDGIGGQIEEGLSNALDIHSAPPWATEDGGFIITGLVQGLEGGLPNLLDSLQQMSGVLEARMGAINEQLAGKLTDAARKGLEAQRDSLQETIDSIADTVADLPDKVHGALADAFDASATIDRTAAKNIDAVRKLSATMQGETQAALDATLSQAQQIADPEEAAKFFQQQSGHILELAKLQDQYYTALNDGDAQRALDLQEQIDLITRAQTAEKAALDERMALSDNTGLAGLAGDLQTVLDAIGEAGADAFPNWQQLYDLLVRISGAASGGPLPGAPAPGVPPPPGMGGAMLAAPAPMGFAPGAIVINAAPGMNEQALAERVMTEIERRYQGRL